MPEKKQARLEDVECSTLNEHAMHKNQDIAKGMGGDVAKVRSPGLKIQFRPMGENLPSTVYCEYAEKQAPGSPALCGLRGNSICRYASPYGTLK